MAGIVFSRDRYKRLQDDLWQGTSLPDLGEIAASSQAIVDTPDPLPPPAPEPIQQETIAPLPKFSDMFGPDPDAASAPQAQATVSGLPSFERMFGPDPDAPQPSQFSGAVTTLGGTPEAEAVTRPGGAGYVAPELDMSSPDAYKRTLMANAQSVAQKYDLPANIIAAIPIQEAGYQGSDLTRRGNNLFSIKGQGPAGSVDYGGVWEVENGQDVSRPASFRKYNSAAESFEDFAKLITETPRYANAVKAWRETRDPNAFIQEVQRAGYATDPTWAGKVASIATGMPSVEAAGVAGTGAANGSATGAIPANVAGQLPGAGVGSLTPNQFTAGQTLSSADAAAACGPAAAVAFARRNGRNPTLDEAVSLAREVGWNPNQGMAGPASQVKLLEKMGVAASMSGVDENKIAADVQRGNPVILDTPGHYFVAERYDPESGKFDFGNSARALRASAGTTWYSIQELAKLGMGAVRTAIHMDSPESPSPSVVAGRSAQEFRVENAPEIVQAVDNATNPDLSGMRNTFKGGLSYEQAQAEERAFTGRGGLAMEPPTRDDWRTNGTGETPSDQSDLQEQNGDVPVRSNESGGLQRPGGVDGGFAPPPRDIRGDYAPAPGTEPGDFAIPGRELTAPPSPVQPSGAVEPGPPQAPAPLGEPSDPWTRLTSTLKDAIMSIVAPKPDLSQGAQDLQARTTTDPGGPLPLDALGHGIVDPINELVTPQQAPDVAPQPVQRQASLNSAQGPVRDTYAREPAVQPDVIQRNPSEQADAFTNDLLAQEQGVDQSGGMVPQPGQVIGAVADALAPIPNNEVRRASRGEAVNPLAYSQEVAYGAADAILPEGVKRARLIDAGPVQVTGRDVGAMVLDPSNISSPFDVLGLGAGALVGGGLRRIGQNGVPWQPIYQNAVKAAPSPTQGISKPESLRRAFVRAWTDDRVDLAEVQREAAQVIGRPLNADEMVTELSRRNPLAAAEVAVKSGPFRDAVQSVGDNVDTLAEVLTYRDNIDVAAATAERVTTRALQTNVPIVGEKAVSNAEAGLAQAQKRLDDVLANPRPAAGPEHTAYGDIVEKQFQQVERMQQRVERVRLSQEQGRLDSAGGALEKARAELDRVRELRDTPDEPLPNVYARMIKDTEHAYEVASNRFDQVQESFANRLAQREVESAEASLTRAQRIQEQVQQIQTADRERVLRNADKAVDVAQNRFRRAQDILAAGTQERIRFAMAKGTAAADARKFSGGINVQESMDRLDWLQQNMDPAEWQKVSGAADEINKWVDSYRQRMVDAGVWSQELADELRRLHPNYVPTRILDYMKEPSNIAVGKSLSLRDRGLRQTTIEGTERAQENPLASLIRYAAEAENIIAKNETYNAFVKLAQQAPDVIPLRKVPSGYTKTNGEELITGFENGVATHYVTTAPIAAAVKLEASKQIPFVSQATRLFRELITRSPIFVAGQVPMDAMSFMVRETARENGNAPKAAIELVRAYVDAFKGLGSGRVEGDLYRYLREGAGMAGIHDRSARAMATTLDDVTRKNMLEIRSADDVKRLAKWLASAEWSQAVGQRVEMAPRLAAGRLGEQRALRAGAKPDTATLKGVMDFRDVTLDFQRGGTWARTINQAVPFFNVGWQSAATVQRAWRENPKAFPLTAMALIGAPTAAAEAWNRSDPQRSKDYDDVKDYVKDRGIVFMLPGVENEDAQGNRRPNYALIPLRELAPFAILAREATAKAMGNDTRGFGALIGAGVSAASPIQANNPADAFNTFTPFGISTGLQLATNRDTFRGQDIATERNDEEAAAFSKALADRLGVRPSQVEFAIRDMGGYAGSGLLATSDAVTGNQKPGSGGIGDTPIVGGLVKRYVGNSIGQDLQDARDSMLSEPVRQALRDAGMRDDELMGVSGTVKGVQFTREQQASAQELMNDYLEREISATLRSSEYRNPRADHEALIREAASRARQLATKRVMDRMPPQRKAS